MLKTALTSLIYLVFLALVLPGCSGLFYQGNRFLYTTPDKFGITYKEVQFNSTDGTELYAWHLLSKTKPKGLVLQFHGNAQNISSHFLSLSWLTQHGYDVISFDYRGYGLSKGTPTQKGVHQDALKAMELAHRLKNERQAKRLIIYGQSLGGVISMAALEDFKHKAQVDLVVMDSTFSSYQNIAFDKLKGHWLTFLLSPLAYILVSDEKESTQVIPTLAPVPLLVIHSKKDPVVPYKFGKDIFTRAKRPKSLWSLEEAGHINVFFIEEKKYQKKFVDFLRKTIP